MSPYPSRTTASALAVVFLTLLLGGCGSNFGFPGVYKINVEQGNIVTEEMVAQLKPGMSRRQVRFIMGTPLIEDTFHEDRWDYRYTLRNGNDTLNEERLTVFFDGDSLSGVTGTKLPAWAEVSGSADDAETSEADAGT